MTDSTNGFPLPDSPKASGIQSELATRGCVFDIRKYAVHDGPGIRTTLFFKGCPLRCRWCHRPQSWRPDPEVGFHKDRCVRCGRCVEACPEHAICFTTENGPSTDADRCQLCGACAAVCLSSAKEIIGAEMTVDQVITELEKDLIFYEESGGGVTFSGGEPLMQPQFLLALLNQCRARKIHTTIDTTCYAEPELVLRVAKQSDLFLCDLKHMDTSMHQRFTGVDNSLILSNIRQLCKAGAEVIIRIPIVPGFNDDPANIAETADFAALLAIRSIDIRPYHSGSREKPTCLPLDFESLEAETPDAEQMRAIADTFEKRGFQVITRPS